MKKMKHMDQNSTQRRKRTQNIFAKLRVRRISFCVFKSLQIASINITLSFSAKKMGDFKVMEGFPMSLQSVLFTLANLLLLPCCSLGSHRRSMAAAPRHV